LSSNVSQSTSPTIPTTNESDNIVISGNHQIEFHCCFFLFSFFFFDNNKSNELSNEMNNILNCLIEIDNIEREIIVYLFEAL
jgi:hypothetical protein